MAADKPFRLAAVPAPPAQQPNEPSPQLPEQAASARALEDLEARRVRCGGRPIAWPEVLAKLPVRIG